MKFRKPPRIILAAFVLAAAFMFFVWLTVQARPTDDQPVEEPVTLDLKQDGSRLELITRTAADPDLQVRPIQPTRMPALMGRTERTPERLVFAPALPMLAGQPYVAEWTGQSGHRHKLEFKFNPLPPRKPTVRMEPRDAALPANALKVYLHFSEPMEQGVFLDRLRLLDQDGKEVIGPFRETELWSPDGKRLTVWFHPGRQKAGVNLNVDEGPVLREGGRYTLVVAGTWRSTAGMAMGGDQSFAFTAKAADHECPRLTEWKLMLPKAGTQEPLTVSFDEALDPAMLRSALAVRSAAGTDALQGQMEVSASAKQWSFRPDRPWAAGLYEIRANPELEDLAGNSLIKPFEVDATAAAPPAEAPTTLTFDIP